jgi:hypothetical protein
MATSRAKTTVTRRTTSRATTRRPDDDVDVVVTETGGLDIDAGIGIVTTVLLIAALIFVDYEMGHGFGAGMFFK